MKKAVYILAFILIGTYCYAQESNSITTFILVRHAEKGNDGTDDPDLKTEGVERANKLATMLKNASIDAVYSTKFKRTKNTVAPLATEKKLEVQIYESLKDNALENLLTKYPGGTIVIAGHSNTIPQIANQLLGKEQFKNFTDSEYGNLLIISVVQIGKSAKVTWMNY